MNEYIFPFHTCEKPNKIGIAQPYSVFFNLISCFIIFYFLFKTKNNYSFFLLFSILLFELFHSFSHSIHLNGTIQITITHLLAYLVNLSYFIFLYNYTHVFPYSLFLFYLLLVILFDIYAFHNLNFIFYIATQFLLFISLFVYYYSYFTPSIKNKIPYLFLLTFLILLLFINEQQHCEKMLDFFPHFPFHIFIEIVAIIIVYIICSIFYKL
jgi:hypothetical protein